MPNLKDTDFDDLFRRASDKYPLRTDSSDWNRMAAALEKDPSPDTPDESDNTDRRRRRRFFWWFLLLPLAGIGYYTVHQSGSGSAGHEPANAVSVAGAPAKNAADKKPAADNAADKDGNTVNNTTEKNANNTTGATKRAADGGAAKPNAPDQTTADAPAPSAGLAGAGMPRKAHRMVNSRDPKNSSKGIRSAGEDVPVRPQTAGNVAVRPQTVATAETAGNAPVRPQTAGNPPVRPQTAGTAGGDRANESNDRFADKSARIDPRTNPIAAAFTLRAANINEQRARIAGPYALSVKVNAPAAKPKDSTKSKAKTHYLYAGISAAPDLSTVKFQKTKGVGTTFGILIGYAFSSHWAIETGAYLDRKRYYTDGEYFSTKNIYMPPNAYLQNADGTCYMWEIPLNVRYTFNPQGKTRWFATAGLSTYLMNSEKYTGALESYTGAWSYSHTWNLHKSSQYPFSIIGFSAGFEQRLGNVGNLRIEPYVRVPLGGIGTGSLPILSTGINIGITKRLWK